MKSQILVAIISILALAGCTKPDETRRVLEQSGYTQIEITGYRPFSGDDDWYETGFRAKAPNGQIVTGAVTRGLFLKGNTIRLD